MNKPPFRIFGPLLRYFHPLNVNAMESEVDFRAKESEPADAGHATKDTSSKDLFEPVIVAGNNQLGTGTSTLLGTFVKKVIHSNLGPLKNLTPIPETFKQRYAQLHEDINPNQLETSGLVERYNALNDLYTSHQRTREHIRYYAPMLDSWLHTTTEPQTNDQVMLCLHYVDGMMTRYQEKDAAFLSAATDFIQASLSVQQTAPPPSLAGTTETRHEVLLVNFIANREDSLFEAIRTPTLVTDNNEVVYPTAADRLQAIESSLSKPTPSSRQSINVLSHQGKSLLHQTVEAGHLHESEKTAILRGLVNLNADVNQPNVNGDTPLQVALEYRQKQPRVVQTLEDLGAELPASEQFRIAAHLLGIGGTLPSHTDTVERKTDIQLEGLSGRLAEDGLDPVIIKTLHQASLKPASGMQGPLEETLKAWSAVRNFPAFIHALEGAQAGETHRGNGPGVIITGWWDPSGHAIGFVFNEEADGGYLYACNTGNNKDGTRSIVKYKIVDYEKLLRFFDAASNDRNETRSFYAGPAELWGVRRCPEEEQLPIALDKSSQKRGNCPIAARKACALAMLWSTSRRDDVAPKIVKATYKEITTELRREGARRAMDFDIPALQGKALVSLLTKLDRPGNEHLAGQLANVIIKQCDPFFWWMRGGAEAGVPEATSPEYLATLDSALKKTGQDIKAIKTRDHKDLAAHARGKGHLKAARVLEALINPPLRG